MKSEIDEVALQGIEFWSNVCEEEISLCVEAEEAQEQGRVPENVSRHYARGWFAFELCKLAIVNCIHYGQFIIPVLVDETVEIKSLEFLKGCIKITSFVKVNSCGCYKNLEGSRGRSTLGFFQMSVTDSRELPEMRPLPPAV